MKLLLVSTLICFAATLIRTGLGHPSAAPGPSLLRREESTPDSSVTQPTRREYVRDYLETFQNADGLWVEGKEAARVCLKYFIRYNLLDNVEVWPPLLKLVDLLEGCMKRHKADFIDIDGESSKELEDASSEFFRRFRSKRGARRIAAETFGVGPRARPRRGNGSRRRRPPDEPPKPNKPFKIVTPILEKTGRSILLAFTPRQRSADEKAGSSGPASSAWSSGARAVPFLRPV